MTEVIKHEYSSNILSAEEIDEAPEEFGTFSTYEEFQTRASRRKDVGMDDPLSAKLGEFDLNDPANENEEVQEHERYMYIPAVTKETLECEWQVLFGCENFKKGLKNLAYDGRLRDCTRFRGVCWRIFLECLPEDSNCWLDAVSESRKTYKNLKSKLLVDPYSNVLSKENVQVFNPLSQESDSPWTQYFEDKKLHEVIHQDLDRLFPGMHYFQSKKIKDILLHILFCYARTNPNVGYKQGMHEILAPIVFVLEYDSEVYEFLDNSDNELMKNLINPEFLESDAFCLFERLMDVIEPWYARGDLPSIPSKQTFDPSVVPFMEEQPLLPPTAVVRKLNRIQENMLKKYDTVLYSHLRDMNIEPQLYGLRWVRLLYGREFTTMEDILTLWDGIFADGLSLDLVDYVYLSLVCSKRRKLLSSDHFGCITILMKTPYCRKDAKLVVLEAKHMRDTRLDPKRKMVYLAKEQPKSSVAPEFPNQDAFHSRITNGLQAVLRGTRQIPSKRGPEINDTYNAQNRLENKSSGNEKKKPVEMKENNKSSPSSHMFPSDPDDEDLFMMSPRSNRTSASTAFLSKLSSKVRHPSRTDITALQQDHERLQDQVSHFKAEVDKLQSISIYCGSKMDTYINHLQEQITQDEKCMDVVYLSLAGLKQVRDILKGTLTFHGSTIEQDSEFSHIDTAITSLTPNTKTSTDNKLPNSLPVPLLADYGHFQKQKEEFILIESSEGEKDDCGANERTSDNFKSENVDDISSDLID